MDSRYTLRQPIASDRDSEGMVISRHRTVEGARKALARQQAAAKAQGGFSQVFIWDDRSDCHIYPNACPGCGADHSGDHKDGCRWFVPRPGRWDRLDQR